MITPQKRLECILKSGQIPHALLFSGPKEAGKEEQAYAFATALLRSRKKLENHPDVHRYFPEGKLGLHPIESIRRLSQDVALVPFEGPWKVFILHEAEKMLPVSSNALLKTLEEPAAQTLLILLSSHPERLLPTITSRCQMIEFLSTKPKTPDPALLELLSGNREKLSQFESDQPDAVFETLLLWHRDRLLLSLGLKQHLSFPTHISQIEKTPLLPFSEVEKAIKKIRLAHERATKLPLCLDMFFLFCSTYPTQPAHSQSC